MVSQSRPVLIDYRLLVQDADAHEYLARAQETYGDPAPLWAQVLASIGPIAAAQEGLEAHLLTGSAHLSGAERVAYAIALARELRAPYLEQRLRFTAARLARAAGTDLARHAAAVEDALAQPRVRQLVRFGQRAILNPLAISQEDYSRLATLGLEPVDCLHVMHLCALLRALAIFESALHLRPDLDDAERARRLATHED